MRYSKLLATQEISYSDADSVSKYEVHVGFLDSEILNLELKLEPDQKCDVIFEISEWKNPYSDTLLVFEAKSVSLIWRMTDFCSSQTGTREQKSDELLEINDSQKNSLDAYLIIVAICDPERPSWLFLNW